MVIILMDSFQNYLFPSFTPFFFFYQEKSFNKHYNLCFLCGPKSSKFLCEGHERKMRYVKRLLWSCRQEMKAAGLEKSKQKSQYVVRL